MTLTNKQWTMLSVVTAALILALAIFGGTYRAVGGVVLLFGFMSLKHRSEERKVSPIFHVIGWIIVAVVALATIGSIFAIAGGR